MKSESLARLLFEQETLSSLKRTLDRYASALDEEVIYALGRMAEEHQVIDARHTVKLARIAQLVAQRLGTSKAFGLAAWFQSASSLANLDYGEAIAQLENAEELLSSDLPKSQLLGMSVNRILLLKQTGKYQAAVYHARQALKVCTEIGPPVDHHKANLHRLLGQANFFMGNYQIALRELDLSKEHYWRLDDVTNVAMLAMSRTLVLEALGMLELVESELSESLKVLQGISAHKEAARVRFRLGEFAYLSGQYELALKYLEQARYVFAEQQLVSEVASIDLVRSSILLKLSFIGEAVQLAKNSEEILRDANLPYFEGIAARNQALGYLLSNNVQEAKRCNERAIKAFKRIKAQAQTLEAQLLSVRILLKTAEGPHIQNELQELIESADFELPPHLLSRALLYRAEIFLSKQVSKPDVALRLALRASKIAQDNHLIEQRIRAASIGAQACSDLDDPVRERRFHLNVVKNLGHFQSIAQTELVRLGQSRTWDETIKRAVNSVHDAVLGSTASIEELTMLVAISRGFRSEYQTSDANRPNRISHLTSELTRQIGELRKEWHWHYEAVENRRRLSGSGNEFSLDLRTIQQRLKRIEGHIIDHQLRLASLGVQTTLPTLLEKNDASFAAEIHNSLKMEISEESALLVYYHAHGFLHCLLMTQDSTSHYPELGKYSQIEELVSKWRYVTNQFPVLGLSKDVYRQSAFLLHELTKYLVLPLELQRVEDFSQLHISLPGRLTEIPFAALHIEDHALVEQYEVCQLTSLGRMGASPLSSTVKNKNAMLLTIDEYTDLQYIKTEIEEIKCALEEAGWLVTDSTESIFSRNPQATTALEAAIIHIAGHGHHRIDNPLFSLVRVGELGLTAADVCLLELSGAPNVFLHACDSGKVEAFGNDAFGLSRAFLRAGASGVIANLWPVIDEFAPEFAKHFYGLFIRNGGNASRALADAQRALIQNYEPIIWANYVYRQ